MDDIAHYCMIKYFSIFLLILFSTCVHANTVIIGNGSGNLSRVRMVGLKRGDTLGIRPGQYSGGRFERLYGITIINYKGLVTFTGTVEFANLENVQFVGSGKPGLEYGISFSNIKTDAITFMGHTRGSSFRHIEFKDVLAGNGVINPQLSMLVYDGVRSTTKTLLNCRFSHIHLLRCVIFMANFKGPFTNVQDSCEYAHIIVDSPLYPIQITATGLYHADIHHWKINPLATKGANDYGLFMIYGNAKIHDCIRTSSGNWGWFARIFQSCLNQSCDSYIYNNIDLGSISYGFVDYRQDTFSNIGRPHLSGGNVHVINNTLGNYRNQNNYVTPIFIDYGHKGFYAEVRNNLQFNSPTHGITDFSGGDKIIESNNLYFANAQDILEDTNHAYLKEQSPAIDAGYTVPYVATDIDGIKRPQGSAYDVGARESLHKLSKSSETKASKVPGHPWIFVLLVICAFGILISFKLRGPSSSVKSVFL